MILSAYLVNIIDLPSVYCLDLSRQLSDTRSNRTLSLKPRHRRKRQNVVEVALCDSSLVSHGQTLFRAGALVIAFSISAPVKISGPRD